MNLDNEGLSCVYCKAYLLSDDDVVYCPVCGAPHHRECYESLGHCALEELHGTDRQYSREAVREAKEAKEKESEKAAEQTGRKIPSPYGANNANDETTVKCRFCGENYPVRSSNCPKCGAPNYARISGIEGFDFYGGVNPHTQIADGVTAEEAQKFVISNTQRYIPKFVKFKENKKTSWNWLAFLFPNCWLLSRKMYKHGIIMTLLLTIASLLAYPFVYTFINLGISQTEMLNPSLMQSTLTQLPANFPFTLIAALASVAIMTASRFITAIFGDYWYYNHTVNTVRKIREENSDTLFEEYRKKGGVNVFMFLLGYLILEYLPAIIFTLI